MNTEIIIEDSWKNDDDTSRVIKFYVEDESIKDTFSYIYDSETDEIEFSFDVLDSSNTEIFPIYYTVNGRNEKTEVTSTPGEKYKIATISINGEHLNSTVIVRVPAYNKTIREDYQYNKSQAGLISPGDYNPILGSNLYKNQGNNVYVTKDTYEDYIRSSNIEGHPLDEVGRRQVLKDKGYYKIYKTLKLRCNQLERTVDSDGNYYSSDRSTKFYVVSGVYTYDLYDSNKNLLRENVPEITPHISMFNATINKRAFNPDDIGENGKPTEKPVLGKVFRLDDLYESYNHTYIGQLFYEDFDGIIQSIQSENHITLEKFVAVNFGEDTGTPTYWENDYPLYIVGPNKNDSISFYVQLKKEEEAEEYPDIAHMTYSFSNPEYKKYFNISCEYLKDSGRIRVTITALENNNDDDPWRPSYARVLPSLEKTIFELYSSDESVEYLTAVYYVIQKSSKIGIIPKKYESRESNTPIDLDRDEFGRYLLKISEGIGVKIAYLGITSEVDPYDRDIVRNWAIREDMSYTDETGSDKVKEREYFFESYTGKFEDKIVFITGAYDGELSPFKIRDYIDRSDIWRQAIYESEVTVIPIIDNIDKTVDLGGGWSYTLDTATNYFIGTNLLYLFNEDNRYYTQRFNLEFSTPEHTGPSLSNFKASINDINLLGGTNRNETYDEEYGITYTYYDNPVDIYTKLFGTSDTARELVDREKDSDHKIEIKRDDNYVTLTPVSNKYISLTFQNTGCLALDSDGEQRIERASEDPLYIPFTTVDTGWEALNPQTGLSYSPKKFLNVVTENTGYPAIDPTTGKQKENNGTKYYLKVIDIPNIPNPDHFTGWHPIDSNGSPNSSQYVVVTSTNTGYLTVGGNLYYLNLTTSDTGYPAFDSNGDRIRNQSNVPLSIPLTLSDTGWEALDTNELSYDPPQYVDVTSTNTGYPAYSAIRHKYIDKYKTLVEIKSSKRKRLFFCFEDIVGRTVKFDMIYPQDSSITTKDIEQIPTVNPLKFIFRLTGTGAVYELQEIRFYCGIEGIQPLKLLSNSEELYPEPGQEYSGYPEVELKESSSKFNIISETYSEAFPNWELISAYDTFDYTWPNGNEILVINDSNGVRFSETDSYLQVDYKNLNGGSDFIDFIRVRGENLNWWNDWRFFIYNKFTNRFSLFSSSGSPELSLKDVHGDIIKTINFDKIGLYRIHISTKNQGLWKKLSLTQTSARVNSLYTVNIDDTGAFFGPNGGDADKLLKGHIHRGEKIEPNTPISIKTSSGEQGLSSFVLYLWYEGCSSGEEVKAGGGRIEFELIFTPDSGGEVTFKKSISVLQTPTNGNFGDHDIENFFELTSYKFNNSLQESSYGYSDRRFPIKNFVLGFPIFNAVPGKISLSYNKTYPYKLGIGLDKNEDNFLKYTEIYQIDSPKTSDDYSGSGDVPLAEEGCYIVDSFINGTYELRPDTYGKTNETWERDDFYNQPRRLWTITFTDGRGKTFSNTLYYDSPIDTSLLELVSLGAKNQTHALGHNSNDFIVNAGIDDGLNNENDSRNKSTFYYEYSSSDQVLKFPRKDIERLVIDERNPIEIHLLKKAVRENGSLVELNSTIESLSSEGNTLSLSSRGNTFAAFNWSNIKSKELTLHIFNDSDSNSTNIPLALLDLFSLSDEDKNIGWVTTAGMRLRLKVNPPEGMSPEDFRLMMTSSTPSEDSKYPDSSSWFGLGQRMVSKLEVSTYNIQPSSFYGTENNPIITIPLSWFNNSGNQNHKIEITVSSSNPKSTASKLFFGAEIRKKPSAGQVINTGELITNNPGQVYLGNKVTLTFTASLTTDVVVIPKFSNIEYECFSNYVDFGFFSGPRPSTTRELQVLKLSGNNIVSQATSGIDTTTIPQTTSTNLIGFKIKDYHQDKQFLNLAGRLDGSSDFSSALMQSISGYPVSLSFKVDDKDQRNSVVDLVRLGYNYAIFIQPGYFVVKPHYDYNLNQTSNLYINWYSFRQSGNSVEGSSYVPQNNNYDINPREVYILLPRTVATNSSGDFQKISLSRGGPEDGDISMNPTQGHFFIQEMTVPVYELGYRGGFTYSGKQTNSNISIIADFNNDIDDCIHPSGSRDFEYYRLINRRGYLFHPGSSGGTGGGNSTPDTPVLAPPRFQVGQGSTHNAGAGWGVGEGPVEGLHDAPTIMGPYTNSRSSAPNPSNIDNLNKVVIKKNNNTTLYNLIFTG